jgi:hypothetical protein
MMIGLSVSSWTSETAKSKAGAERKFAAKKEESALERRLVPVNEQSGVGSPPTARRNFSPSSDLSIYVVLTFQQTQ